MLRSVRVAVGFASLWFAAGVSAACSSNSGSHPSAFDPNATAGTAGTGTGTGGDKAGGLDIGTGAGTGTAGGSNTSGGNGGLTDACAAHLSTAMPIPLDMYIMLDISSSMLDATAAKTTKWAAVKTALESFLQDKSSAGLGVGLQYFPLEKPNAPTSCSTNADCGDSAPCFLKACSKYPSLYPCDVAADCVLNNTNYGPCQTLGQCSLDAGYVCPTLGKACGADDMGKDLGTCDTLVSSVCMNTESCDATVYATPASAIATLPGAAAGVLASIDAKTPAGATPTAPAISGAIQQASTWATAHPDHRVVVVLATDGLPTECTPTAIGSVAALAKAGVAATPSISTFVIGVFGQDDVLNGAPDNLNEIAQQGGTKTAFIVDTTKDVTAQFVTALDTIRGSHLACEFQVPQPSAGQTLDFGQVNVQYTNAGKSSVVYYVGNATACDATTGGWYYDVDPAKGTPTKIVACAASCSSFEAATEQASVGIALGCMTVVK
ncbi:MAG: vWA domain-containing protein [Polyangiaceae bacterium]